MKGSLRLSAFLLFTLAAPAMAGAPDPMRLGDIRLRLVYRQSGELSPDILRRDPPAVAFNLVIGGLDEGGAADDAVVMVPVIGPNDREQFSDVPVSIRVFRGRKLVASRSFGGTLTQPGGSDWKALYLPGVTCDGRIRIEAVRGRERKSAAFDFLCGE